MWTKHRLSLGLLVVVAGLCASDYAAALGGGAGLSSKSAQGYLGIYIRDVSEDQLPALKLKEPRGAEITDVDHDGPACKAGLQMRDVILQLNGQVVENGEQLRRMLRETPPGRTVSLVISRDGQQQTISMQMADRETVEREAWEKRYRVPAPDSSYAAPHVGNGFLKSSAPSVMPAEPKGHRDFLGTTMILSASFTGAKLEVMGPQLAQFFGAEGSAGLLVRSVDPNSPAEMAGMKAGDVVVKVNQISVASGSDWSKTIHENKNRPVAVVVLRDKHEQTLTLVPDSKKRSSVRMGTGLEEYLGEPAQLVAAL